MSRTVLVIGTRKYSLGWWIAETLKALYVDSLPEEANETSDGRWNIVTAGVDSNEERIFLDLAGSRFEHLLGVLNGVNPDHIICTAGINQQRSDFKTLSEWYDEHYLSNVIGPMRLLEAWETTCGGPFAERPEKLGFARHYVAISSNSAHIARTYSAAYCASKAALSMALRCKAREMKGQPFVVYGYEPGLLAGTPMTDEVNARLGTKAASRIPGHPEGLPTPNLAAMVVRNLNSSYELNGCLLRVDGGDQ